jgi:hypothetical protein
VLHRVVRKALGAPGPERTRRLVLAAAILLGAALAWHRLSIVDDAFVSLRYAERWTMGKGLTWNDGESVLGIDNVGWTVLLAAIHRASGLSLPHVALLANAAGWLLLVAATEWLGRSLPSRATLGAPALVAASGAVVDFGSTGLETAAAAGGVTLAAALLVKVEKARDVAVAGTVLAVTGVLRFDHLLFHGLGLLLLPTRWWAHWFAPSLVLEALTAWSVVAYGDPLPNSLLASSGRGIVDGLFTVALWWGSVPLLGVLALAGIAVAQPPLRRLALAFGLGWHVALIARGGDPTFGRSLLVILPLAAVLAEGAVVAGAGRPAGRVAAVLLATALVPVPLLPARTVWKGQANASTFYRVRTLNPVVIDHADDRTGRALYELFTDRGLRVTLATWSPGLVGFLSRQEVVDVLGGTDRELARARTGTPAYLRAREVDLSRRPPDAAFEEVTRVRTRGPDPALRGWHLYRYDPAFAATVRLYVPELVLPSGPAWVRQRTAALPDTEPEVAAAELRFLDAWWFPWQPQPVVRMAFEERAGAGR